MVSLTQSRETLRSRVFFLLVCYRVGGKFGSKSGDFAQQGFRVGGKFDSKSGDFAQQANTALAIYEVNAYPNPYAETFKIRR